MLPSVHGDCGRPTGDFTETGFCLIETAAAMNQMATAYTKVEQDNTGQVNKVHQILDSLGEV